MGSIRGLRCDHCHTEVLATASHAAVIGGAAWTLPVLCCGQPLRPLETGQVLSANLPRRRVARCGRCGYEVCVIVHPARVLVCAICQADLVVGNADRAVATIGEAQVSGQVSSRG
jgi:ribosomal protein S27E